MPSPTFSATRSRLLLLAVWVIFYASFTLFVPPLLDDADSVHAEVAREILTRHDWVTLHANGIRYLEKAPLMYWGIAASFRAFGVSTAAARLPLALAVLALALAMETFARRAFASAQAGLYAGLILLSSFGYFIYTRITIPDIAVCLWLTLALYAFWRTEQAEHPPRAHCWLFATCCALNVLTKGLIGIVFPVGIVLGYLLLTGRLGRIRRLHLLSSTLLFLVLAAPWHILAALANPSQGNPAGITYAAHHWNIPLPSAGNVHGWAWFYLVNEHLLRYLNLRVPHDYDTVPLGAFYGLCLVWIIPWSAFLPSALVSALRPLNRTNLLLLLWAAIPLAFFALSTRQEYYVLPALPALILLIARWLTTAGPQRLLAWALFAAGTLASATAFYLLLHTHPPPPGTDVATLLTQNPAAYALSFGHFFDLNVPALGLFRVSLLLTAILPFAGTLWHLRLRLAGQAHRATLALAGATLAMFVPSHLALQTFAPALSSAQLAEAIRAQAGPGDLIVIHGEYEAGSSLGFYLRRADLHIWEGRSANLWYGSFFTDAPQVFESTASMQYRWRDPQRIFLWQDLNDAKRPLPQLPGAIYVVAAGGGKEILSNQPNH